MKLPLLALFLTTIMLVSLVSATEIALPTKGTTTKTTDTVTKEQTTTSEGKITQSAIVEFTTPPTAEYLARATASTSATAPTVSGITGFETQGFNADTPYAGASDTGFVNLYSGSLVKTETDVSLGGRGVELSLSRTYNSNIYSGQHFDVSGTVNRNNLNKPGWLGYGWSGMNFGKINSPLYWYCEANNDREFTVERPDGSVLKFIYDDMRRSDLGLSDTSIINDDGNFYDKYILEDGSRVDVINFAQNVEQGKQVYVITSKDGTQYIYSHHVYPSVRSSSPPREAYFDVKNYCDPAAPWDTSVQNPYSDDAVDQDGIGVIQVRNQHAGIYLTKIIDVYGNYVTIEYDDQREIPNLANPDGDMGFEPTWGSPYPSVVTDPLGRKVTFTLLDRPGKQDYEKLLDYVEYPGPNGNTIRVDYQYGSGSSTISSCQSTWPNLCDSTAFLIEVAVYEKLPSGSLNQLLPKTEYYYGISDGMLEKVVLPTGAEVDYDYTKRTTYWTTEGVTSNQPNSRFVLESISVRENPGASPITTEYFYDVGTEDGIDDSLRETYVVYPDGENGRTVKKSVYLSLNPNQASDILLLKDFKNGVHLYDEIYETTNEEPVLYEDQTSSVQSSDIITRLGNLKSRTTNFYTADFLGSREIYSANTPFLTQQNGQWLWEIPNRRTKAYVRRTQGQKTEVFDGGETSMSFATTTLDKFGNPKTSINYGFVDSASKQGANGIGESCSGFFVNKVNTGYVNGLSWDNDCIFEGNTNVADNTESGPQDYSITTYEYAHETDADYLGSQSGEGTCSGGSCDPLAGFRNKHYQIVGLPTTVTIKDINGNKLAETKYNYDEVDLQVSALSSSYDNYDLASVRNKRGLVFTHGVDFSGDSCTAKKGLLTSTETWVSDSLGERYESEGQILYDETGQAIVTVAKNNLVTTTAYGSQAPDPDSVALTNYDACAGLNYGSNGYWGTSWQNGNEADASSPIEQDGNQNFNGFPTETRVGNFKTVIDYDYNTGLVEKETLSNTGASVAPLDNTYKYDGLSRLTSVYRTQDSSPFQIMDYVDMPSAGTPQHVIVKNKQAEIPILFYCSFACDGFIDVMDDLGLQYVHVDSTRDLDDENLEEYPAIIWADDAADFRYYFETSSGEYRDENNQRLVDFLQKGGNLLIFSQGFADNLADFQYYSGGSTGGALKLTNFPEITGSIPTVFALDHEHDPSSYDIYDLVFEEGYVIDGYYNWANSVNSNLLAPGELKSLEILAVKRQRFSTSSLEEFTAGIRSSDGKITILFLYLERLGEPYRVDTLGNFINNLADFNNPITNYYDGLGRNFLTAQEDPQDGQIIIAKTEYDIDGNKKKVVKPHKISTSVSNYFSNPPSSANEPAISFKRDALKRITEVQTHGTSLGLASGEVDQPIVTSYAAKSTTQIDKEGKELKTNFDAKGLVLNEEIKTGGLAKGVGDLTVKKVTRNYDARGNPDQVTVLDYDASTAQPTLGTADRTIDFSYDSKGRLERVTSPDFGTISKRYDEMDNEVYVQNAEGQTVVRNEFDRFNRLKSETIGGYGTITYTYDDEGPGYGQLKTVTDQSGTWTYNYDEYSRLVSEVFTPNCPVSNGDICNSVTTSYEYYSSGQIKSMTHDGNRVEYDRDKLGRITKVVLNNQDIVKDFDYTASGELEKIKFGNNIEQTYNYYDRDVSLLESMRVTDTSGQVLWGRKYEYTPSLNLKKQIEILPNWLEQDLATFDYDDLNQLKTVTDLNGYYGNDFEYDYDKLGNILSVTETEGGLARVNDYEYYEGTSRLQSTNDYEFTYDNAGRLVSKDAKVQVIGNLDSNWEEVDVHGTPGTVQFSSTESEMSITASTPHSSTFSYSMPVKMGRKYKITGEIRTDLSQGIGLIATHCSEVDAGLLGPSCKLDNFDKEERALSGTNSWTEQTFYVEATDTSNVAVNGLVLSINCYMSPGSNDHAVGTIACRNFRIEEVDQTFTYDANNRVKRIDFSDGECLIYKYDYRGRRTFVQDSSTATTTLYLYDGNDLLSEISHEEEIECSTAPPRRKPKLDIQDGLPSGLR